MLKSYVKRTGHFTDSQKKAYETLSQKYIIPFKDEQINFSDFFNSDNITIEIGFGSGAATVQIAQENTDKNYLGIEVHRPGIGRLLREIDKRSLSNIKIIEYDAFFVFEKMIPQSTLDAIHIFFPDPWQKKRHHKRRLIQHPFTNLLSDALKPDGYLYMVTDWEDYAAFALNELNATEGLCNSFSQFAEPQSWRPKTRFEQKGLEKDHVIKELFFVKKNIKGED